MNRKKGIFPFTSVELIQVVLKNIKKEKKWERKEVAAKSRNIQVTTLQWQWSLAEAFLPEPVRGQKIEERVVTDLDVRNDDKRPV